MNIQHFPHPEIEEPENTDVTIDFSNTIPQDQIQPPIADTQEEFRSSRDVISNSQANQRIRRWTFCTCLRFCLRRILICVSRMIKFICTRKVYFFIFFLMTSTFLRLSQLFSEKFIFWTTYFPMIIILVAGIFKLCLMAQRSRDEFETSVAQRRSLFNERLLRQIVMHDIQHRLQIAVAMDPRRSGFQNVHASMQAIQNQRAIIRQILFELGTLEDSGFFAHRQNLVQAQVQGLPEEQIQELPLEEYNLKGDPETCSICIDEFEQGTNLRVLPCSHRYHPKCIDDWLKIQNNCPNCKAEIPRRGGRNNINVGHPHIFPIINLRDDEDF